MTLIKLDFSLQQALPTASASSARSLASMFGRECLISNTTSLPLCTAAMGNLPSTKGWHCDSPTTTTSRARWSGWRRALAAEHLPFTAMPTRRTTEPITCTWTIAPQICRWRARLGRLMSHGRSQSSPHSNRNDTRWTGWSRI